MFSTIHFLKTRQIIARLSLYFKKNLLHPLLICKIKRLKTYPLPIVLPLVAKPTITVKHNLSVRSFVFLNLRVSYKNRINWNDPQQEKLWLYHLHYFGYLLNEPTIEFGKHFDNTKAIIMDWIENNPIGKGNGWEPYPLSLRMVNWIMFYCFYQTKFKKEKAFQHRFLTSLWQQARYLPYFLEYHLMANHLFVNIKAMVFAALFFQKADWLQRYAKKLQTQLREQILDDGGHFERSPMYHSPILTDILDLLNVFNCHIEKNENQKTWFRTLEEYALKMLLWLKAMGHTEAVPALFGDSAFNAAPSSNELLDYFKRICGNNKHFNSTTLTSSMLFKPSG